MRTGVTIACTRMRIVCQSMYPMAQMCFSCSFIKPYCRRSLLNYLGRICLNHNRILDASAAFEQGRQIFIDNGDSCNAALLYVNQVNITLIVSSFLVTATLPVHTHPLATCLLSSLGATTRNVSPLLCSYILFSSVCESEHTVL